MKKYLALLLTILVLLSFVACGEIGGGNQTDDGGIFSQLQEMSEKGYESISLNVTAQKDGETLTSTYAFKRDAKGIRCDFTRQILQKFEITSSGIVVPDERIKEVKGYEIIDESGKIIEQSDKGYEDASSGIITLTNSKLSLNFSFEEKNFVGAGSVTDTFLANVSNISAFLGGGATGAQDMKIVANYKDGAFTKITLDYTSSTQGKIKAVYTFS